MPGPVLRAMRTLGLFQAFVQSAIYVPMSGRLCKRKQLTSLVAFAVTVILNRAHLELTGYPQLGDSVLHIAHALRRGLLLFVAILLPLALANRWAIQASALLSGICIGHFIDEVGKFIPQTNDYFFPPAATK